LTATYGQGASNVTDKDKQKPRRAEDEGLEREILSHRKFSLAEAIGRMGSGLLKGVSPVTHKRQAELKIERYLEQNLIDSEGALEVVLLRRVRESELSLKMGYDQPLAALAALIEQILSSESLLRGFVNAVDAQWGRMNFERPHIQKEGQPPDPEDPYTFSSVRAKLEQLEKKLQAEGSSP
jgi:hypothetical protein